MTIEVEALFCDDVRFETTGKQTLVGVYTSDIRVSSPNSTFNIWIWMRVQGVTAGRHTFSISLSSPSKGSQTDADGEIEVTRPGFPLPIAVGPLPVTIVSDGKIIASISIDNTIVHTAEIDVAIAPHQQRQT